MVWISFRCISFRFKGLEYWFINDVTRGWDIQYNIHNHSYTSLLESVKQHKNDLALCSIWLTDSNYDSFSLSSYFDQQCLTIMVPRQTIINVAAVIYLSVSKHRLSKQHSSNVAQRSIVFRIQFSLTSVGAECLAIPRLCICEYCVRIAWHHEIGTQTKDVRKEFTIPYTDKYLHGSH